MKPIDMKVVCHGCGHNGYDREACEECGAALCGPCIRKHDENACAEMKEDLERQGNNRPRNEDAADYPRGADAVSWWKQNRT